MQEWRRWSHGGKENTKPCKEGWGKINKEWEMEGWVWIDEGWEGTSGRRNNGRMNRRPRLREQERYAVCGNVNAQTFPPLWVVFLTMIRYENVMPLSYEWRCYVQFRTPNFRTSRGSRTSGPTSSRTQGGAAEWTEVPEWSPVSEPLMLAWQGPAAERSMLNFWHLRLWIP